MVEVKLIGVDERTGKLKLSRRALLPKPEGYVEREQGQEGRPPRREDDRRRDDYRGDHRGGDRRDDRRDDRRGGDRRNEPWKPRNS